MKRPHPDTRPSWREAPVIRSYRMADGSLQTEVDPEYERRYREHLMREASHPRWDQDQTYNIRRQK